MPEGDWTNPLEGVRLGHRRQLYAQAIAARAKAAGLSRKQKSARVQLALADDILGIRDIDPATPPENLRLERQRALVAKSLATTAKSKAKLTARRPAEEVDVEDLEWSETKLHEVTSILRPPASTADRPSSSEEDAADHRRHQQRRVIIKRDPSEKTEERQRSGKRRRTRAATSSSWRSRPSSSSRSRSCDGR
jgi:hypothetical protein